MKLTLVFAAILLGVSVTSFAAKNPDGKPGLIGFEPFYVRESNVGDILVPIGGTDRTMLDEVSSDWWRAGLRIIAPLSDTATLRVAFSGGSINDDLATSKVSLKRVEVSVRLWLPIIPGGSNGSD